MLSERSFLRALSWSLPVLVCGWIVRFEFVAILPSYAYSWDISSWEEVAGILGSGENPYATTTFLNWPPLWMVCLFVLGRLAEFTGLDFILVLRLFLVTCESIVIVLTGTLIAKIAPSTNVTRLAFLGFAFNPIAIFLICQHGNFDIIAVIWIIAMLHFLVDYGRSGSDVDWLLACFFLGLAVLTKTFPLALVPLLLPGARSATWKARALGLIFVVGPTALGMSVLFALAPDAIVRNVLLYSSAPGRFGISGLANSLGLTKALALSSPVSSLVLIALLIWGSFKAWSWRNVNDKDLVIVCGLILLTIPTLGPGFGPQYAIWFIAPFVAAFALGSSRWRFWLVVSYIVSAVTYYMLYAYARDLGQFIPHLSGSPRSLELGRLFTKDVPRSWLSLPMFLSWVALLFIGVQELRTPRIDPADAET